MRRSKARQVLELLEGMRRALSKEASEDEEGHAELGRWCRKAEEEQTEIIRESKRVLERQEVVVKEGKAMVRHLDLGSVTELHFGGAESGFVAL